LKDGSRKSIDKVINDVRDKIKAKYPSWMSSFRKSCKTRLAI